jgi:steroid delta-isomerase-like uncharacterized protein
VKEGGKEGAPGVIVQEWAMTGVHSGALKGIKPTEKPVGFAGASVLWLNGDGLVKEEHRYADVGTLLSQIGASKVKARPIPTLPASIEWHVSKGTPDEDKNVEVGKALVAAMNAKKEADYLALNADDLVFDDFTAPVSLHGGAELKTWFKMFTTAFPDLNVNLANAWGVEDFLIMESTVTGTQKGALHGAAVTNKPVTLHSLDIGQVKEGKLSRGWTYGNAVELSGQLGAKPETANAKPASAPATTAKPPSKSK